MRHTPRLLAVILVVGTIAAVPLVGLAAQTTDTATASNASASNAAVAPGAQLSGVVGVQAAELDGEIQSRAYGMQVARAAGNDSRAAVAADRLSDLEARLTELEERRESLREARANGSMSEGEYRARTARLAAETRTVERLTDQTNETVQRLPAGVRRANGVDTESVRTLHDRAMELGGGEVAEIARSVAGERVGSGFGPERAGDRGMGHNESERGAHGRDRGDGGDRGQGASGENDAQGGSASDEATATTTADSEQ